MVYLWIGLLFFFCLKFHQYFVEFRDNPTIILVPKIRICGFNFDLSATIHGTVKEYSIHSFLRASVVRRSKYFLLIQTINCFL